VPHNFVERDSYISFLMMEKLQSSSAKTDGDGLATGAKGPQANQSNETNSAIPVEGSADV